MTSVPKLEPQREVPTAAGQGPQGLALLASPCCPPFLPTTLNTKEGTGEHSEPHRRGPALG